MEATQRLEVCTPFPPPHTRTLTLTPTQKKQTPLSLTGPPYVLQEMTQRGGSALVQLASERKQHKLTRKQYHAALQQVQREEEQHELTRKQYHAALQSEQEQHSDTQEKLEAEREQHASTRHLLANEQAQNTSLRAQLEQLQQQVAPTHVNSSFLSHTFRQVARTHVSRNFNASYCQAVLQHPPSPTRCIGFLSHTFRLFSLSFSSLPPSLTHSLTHSLSLSLSLSGCVSLSVSPFSSFSSCCRALSSLSTN